MEDTSDVKSGLCENKDFVQMRLLRKWKVDALRQCYGKSIGETNLGRVWRIDQRIISTPY